MEFDGMRKYAANYSKFGFGYIIKMGPLKLEFIYFYALQPSLSL